VLVQLTFFEGERRSWHKKKICFVRSKLGNFELDVEYSKTVSVDG